MKIKVKVVPSSSKVCVKEDPAGLKVYLHSSPDKGKANKELIGILAEHFDVSKSRITIVHGATSREKTVAIEGMIPRLPEHADNT